MRGIDHVLFVAVWTAHFDLGHCVGSPLERKTTSQEILDPGSAFLARIQCRTPRRAPQPAPPPSPHPKPPTPSAPAAAPDRRHRGHRKLQVSHRGILVVVGGDQQSVPIATARRRVTLEGSLTGGACLPVRLHRFVAVRTTYRPFLSGCPVARGVRLADSETCARPAATCRPKPASPACFCPRFAEPLDSPAKARGRTRTAGLSHSSGGFATCGGPLGGRTPAAQAPARIRFATLLPSAHDMASRSAAGGSGDAQRAVGPSWG